MADVVEQPREEHDPAAGQDPAELPRRLDGAGGERERDACREPDRDSDTAERRRRAAVPPLAGRMGDEPRRDVGGAEEGPEGERSDR